MASLPDVLEKLGLKYDDLTEEERKTAESWQKTLEAKTLTVQDLKVFIDQQLQVVFAEMAKFDNSAAKDLYLKAVLRNFQLLSDFINAPERSREWLAKHLKDRFNINL